MTEAKYSDGVSAPAGPDRPGARELSNAIVAQSGLTENAQSLTDMFWLWGQFIDHDIDLTEPFDPAGDGDAFPIPVPAGDPFFDPAGTGTAAIDFTRSRIDPATGTDPSNPRQHLNQITAWLDGSVVYGSDAGRAAALREFQGGRLKTSTGDLLPFNAAGLPNAGGPSDRLFLAGDIRANENAALTSMHTVWVREHNRVAGRLANENPGMADEEIYQRARSWVTAEIQAITYNEFLPAMLGVGSIAPYAGYDPTVNPGILTEFSTALYRFGHSMLPSELLRLNGDGTPIAAGPLPLRDAFFSPAPVMEHGVEPLLRGAASQVAQAIDPMVIDDVRNFLFGPPGSGGFDLASLNIQRGRDHGLPTYNEARIALGLAPAASFADVTSDPRFQAALASVYFDVDQIDLWVGGLAEDLAPGAAVGETARAVLTDQFSRIRNGDRFWYQNVFDGLERRQIENTKLADVLRRNAVVGDLQSNVFFDASVNQTDFAAHGGPIAVATGPGDGTVVTLHDGEGNVLRRFTVFDPSFTGGVRAAVADVNGDGVPDLIAGSGPGMTATVKVFDGSTGMELFSATAFEASFTGGVSVTAGDLNRDGFAEVVISPGDGGGPRVRVFNGNGFGLMSDFFGIEDPNYRGGARLALGDLNHDGMCDLLVSAGMGGGPRVAGFDGASLGSGAEMKLFADFFVFEPTVRDGVFVAAGDLNGDGFDEMIAGGGPGGGPRVFALSGFDLMNGGRVQTANFFAGDASARGGVCLTVRDVNGDGYDDVIAGGGVGMRPEVTVFSGSEMPEEGPTVAMASFLAADEGFRGGLFVG